MPKKSHTLWKKQLQEPESTAWPAARVCSMVSRVPVKSTYFSSGQSKASTSATSSHSANTPGWPRLSLGLPPVTSIMGLPWGCFHMPLASGITQRQVSPIFRPISKSLVTPIA